MSERTYEINEQFCRDFQDYPLPEWAARFNEGGYYMVTGAQLCTRNGTILGNAVLTRIGFDNYNGELIAYVVTDAGTKFGFTVEELKRLFFRPMYVMKSDRICDFTPVAPKACHACAWWEHTFEQWGECGWSYNSVAYQSPRGLHVLIEAEDDSGLSCRVITDKAFFCQNYKRRG